MKGKLFSIVVAVAVAKLEFTFAQSATGPTTASAGAATGIVSSPMSEADRTWNAIKGFGRPALSAAVSPQLTSAQRVARSIDEADQLKSFYAQYPGHPAAKDAKRLEAMSLSHAALNGDTVKDERRGQLLAEIRQDAAIPAVRRFEAVAWSNRVGIARQGSGDRLVVLAAEEVSTRALIAEFPTVATGYESLHAIARESAPARGRIIANDLLAMSAAPPGIKVEAQRLLDRCALIGQPLLPILTQAGAAALASAGQDRATVLYAWSKDVPQSLTAAKRMAEQAPQMGFIGLCLDRDLNAARQTAAKAKLPGAQYYEASGVDSPLAGALQTGRTFVVYLTDRTGVIRDVQGRDDFKGKIALYGH